MTANKEFYDSFYSNTATCDKPDYKITNNDRTEGKRILSLGCGRCEDILFLIDKNEIWGLDSSPAAIEKANNLGVKAKIANLEKDLELPDNFFDIIVCKDVLEHLVAPEHLLHEISRVLKDTGVLVINIPNHFYWRFRLRILFGGNLIWKSFFHDHTHDFEEWNYMHIRFLTYNSLLKLLRLCNFHIQNTFWDFGMLTHYADPEQFLSHGRKSLLEVLGKVSLTKKLVITYILLPAYKIINIIFPKKLRSKIVSISPGLLSASFYLRCVKNK